MSQLAFTIMKLKYKCYRAEIRKAGILLNPKTKCLLTSMDGVAMHSNLVNFYDIGVKNYDLYKLHRKNAEMQPLFITKDDEDRFKDINNWKKDKIKTKINNLFTKLDVPTQEIFEHVVKQYSKKTKAELIYLYNELLTAVQFVKSNEMTLEIANVDDEM